RTRGPNVIDDRTRAQQIHGIWCASSLALHVASRLLTRHSRNDDPRREIDQQSPFLDNHRFVAPLFGDHFAERLRKRGKVYSLRDRRTETDRCRIVLQRLADALIDSLALRGAGSKKREFHRRAFDATAIAVWEKCHPGHPSGHNGL